MTKSASRFAPTSFHGLLTVAAIAVLLLLALGGVRRHQELESARARERMLSQRIEKSREKVAELETFVDDLRHDPQTLERVAREQLHMVRPGEVVFVLPPGDRDRS